MTNRLDVVVARLKALRGIRAAAVTALAGALSALAFAPVFAWPVLFLTFPVLIWRLDVADTSRQAALTGWCFGFGYFIANLFWIGEAFLVEAELFAWLLPFAVTLLPAALAVFWGAACALARRCGWHGLNRVVVLALALAAAEYARGHLFTGLPWNLIGYALTANAPMMQSASLVGVYGLTIVALVLFPLPLVALAMPERSWRQTMAGVVLPALAVLAMVGFGLWRLAGVPETATVEGVRLRVVQPSIPQREKWMAEHQGRIFREHLDLSRTDASGRTDDLAGITHVVWPEAAMPFLPLEHPEALAAIAGLLPDGTTLLTGALRRETVSVSADVGVLPEAKLYNGLLAFDSNGAVVARYDKLHLVPFGEYLPFDSVLSALGLKKLTHGRGAFTAGAAPRPLIRVAGLPPAVTLVCYEALFPGAVVQGGERPNVILNVTNDGWFGQTSGPHQHFHQTRVRAVEEGLPLIRAANNGISAIIDGAGQVRARLDLDVKGVIDGGLPPALPTTLYARHGDAAFFALWGLLAMFGWGVARRQA